MFNFLKHKKTDPYIYRMLCRKCDVLFERNDVNQRTCPVCEQSQHVEVYSLIDKRNNEESK